MVATHDGFGCDEVGLICAIAVKVGYPLDNSGPQLSMLPNSGMIICTAQGALLACAAPF